MVTLLVGRGEKRLSAMPRFRLALLAVSIVFCLFAVLLVAHGAR